MDNNNNLKRHITPDALQQIVDLLDESQKKTLCNTLVNFGMQARHHIR